MARFPDRQAAGRELADRVAALDLRGPVVVAVPNGGALVAEPVARRLHAPLAIADAHQVTGHRSDLAVGAVTSDSDGDIHAAAAGAVGVAPEELAKKVNDEQRHLVSLLDGLRSRHRDQPVEGRDVVVVDEALLVAAGVAEAADGLRRRGATRLVLAVPFGGEHVLDALAGTFDDVVCLERSAPRVDIDQWYDDASPVADDEVVAAVERATR